jgi:phenylpropionate dioxygenase-like ring-hydroxylating dioxygenase large terminal subunit
VLLTRDADGCAHAFINVCSHRGVCLVSDECGTSKRFQCPYHGWTFNGDDGRLVGLTSERKFGEVDRSEYGLVALPVEERYGILWGCLTPGAAIDVDEWLGPAAAVLERLQLDTCYRFAQVAVETPNWKATMDGYLETYHNPFLHPDSLQFYENDLSLCEMLGRHALFTYTSKKIREAADQPEDEWDLRTIDKALFLFPNVVLALGGSAFSDIRGVAGERPPGEQCNCIRVMPSDEFEKSVTHWSTYTTEPVVTAEHASAAQASLDDVVRINRDEDFPTVRTQMKGWKSGALKYMTYGRNEYINQMWLHRGLAAILDGADRPPLDAEATKR